MRSILNLRQTTYYNSITRSKKTVAEDLSRLFILVLYKSVAAKNYRICQLDSLVVSNPAR